jgi:hypothetical protein
MLAKLYRPRAPRMRSNSLKYTGHRQSERSQLVTDGDRVMPDRKMSARAASESWVHTQRSELYYNSHNYNYNSYINYYIYVPDVEY